jgi:hypothetical protein
MILEGKNIGASYVAFKALMNNKINRIELQRFIELHKKLMGNNLFVEVGDSPEWKEFNILTNKIYS